MLKKISEQLILSKLAQDENEIRTALLIFGILIVLLFLGMFYLYVAMTSNQNKVYTLNQIAPLVSPIPTIDPTKTPTPTPKSEKIKVASPLADGTEDVKEYFIPLGSGSNQTGDWTDVTGATATLNFGNYKNIKEVYFEASVNVPTANQSVWVRLYNVSDKHPVWNSEVKLEGGPSGYLISSPVVYDTGSKIYQVQMKTQLKYLANLSQSRLRILLK